MFGGGQTADKVKVSGLGAVSIETAPFVFMLLDLQAAPLMHTLCAFETARSHIRTRR